MINVLSSLRVLFVYDPAAEVELMVSELRRAGYEPDWKRVDAEPDLIAALPFAPDLILSDYELAHFRGPRALELARRCTDAPFVFVTAADGQERALNAYRLGASDYLTWDHLDRLGQTVGQALEQQHLRHERDRAERALRASEERMRMMIENSADGIALVNARGCIEYASPSTTRIMGYLPEELLGKNALELLHPDEQPSVVRCCAELHDEPHGSIECEFRCRHRDGSWRWIQGVVNNLLSEPSVGALVINYRDATDSKAAQEELQRRLAELEAVNRISGCLRTVRSLDEIMPVVLRETLAAVDVPAGIIWLYDPTTEKLVPRVNTGWDPSLATALKTDAGIPGHVFQTGQSLLSPDVRTDPLTSENVRSLIPADWNCAVVAIRAEQDVIGVMMVSTRSPRELSHAELHLLETIAGIVGIAIQRASLFEQTIRQLRQLDALHKIDMAITGSLDLRLSLTVLLHQVLGLLGVDAADILLLEPFAQELKYVVGAGFREEAISHAHLSLGVGEAGRAVREGRIVQVSNVAALEQDRSRAQILEREKFVAYLVAPLLARGQVKGVLEIMNRAPLSLSADSLNFVEALTAQAALAIENAKLFESLERSNFDLSLAYDTTLEGWSRALDLRDHETEGHTRRVADATVRLALALGVPESQLIHLWRGALLHDIGKMAIPDLILHKPGPLTPEEWATMRKHPEYAYELLLPIEYLRPALDIPYSHHEQWDGTGYPGGLVGEEIPLAARIFAVVDVWDALRSPRPYRPPLSEAETLDYIRTHAGSHFDPAVVDQFLKIYDELKELADRA